MSSTRLSTPKSVNACAGMGGDAREDVGQPGLRIEPFIFAVYGPPADGRPTGPIASRYPASSPAASHAAMLQPTGSQSRPRRRSGEAQ